MAVLVDELLDDIKKVSQIPVVSTMLEVICSTTGMGFACIARVTPERWIACGVRDEINFGLPVGGELKIETTLCNEVRAYGKLIAFDDVSADNKYRGHHTPRMYGLQSYIAVPIFLKDGSFFGTLCAIDAKPAEVNNSKIIGLFNLFADLISFHLQSLELMNKSNLAIRVLNQQVEEKTDEARQYQFISHHNLADPLRKLRMYSDHIVRSLEKDEIERTRELATKIGASAQKFSMMIRDISAYSQLSDSPLPFQQVNFNEVYADVCTQLEDIILKKDAIINAKRLPTLLSNREHIEQLFFHLLSNALKFSRPGITPFINVFARQVLGASMKHIVGADETQEYVQIDFQDNGAGIPESQLEVIFQIFSKFTYISTDDGYGIGLAYCRKIMRLHGGLISVSSKLNEGSTFSLFFPRALK